MVRLPWDPHHQVPVTYSGRKGGEAEGKLGAVTWRVLAD